MAKKRIVFEGLTFDDVLLLPARSTVLPREAHLTTMLTRGISINIPFVSAAMDTVTESRMAIALAREGGIGILHKNMSISRQCDEADRVKRSESGMIINPVTLTADKLVADALVIMKKFSISGIPVVDERGRLAGILTNRDLRFKPDPGKSVREVMTRENLVTAPLGTTLEHAESILQEYKIEKLPVVDAKGILRGLITFKDIQKKKQYPNACKDELGRLRVGAAVGVTPDAAERVGALLSTGVDVIVIDTAHGHSQGVLKTIKAIRKQYRHAQLIAGNIGTYEAAAELASCGVDAVKVGIGPGSICTTRVVAGVGVPQITAIMEVNRAVAKKGLPLIADGGVRYSGDAAKAIAAGADSVMIGGMFAGVDETPGETVLYEGRSYKLYRGMGSIDAMRQGSKDRYFQDAEDDIKKLVPEGVEGRVPFKGSLADTVYQLTGGLRAAMGYCGVKTIAQFKTRARFTRITNAGLTESHPHNITITKEAPNYHK